MRASVHFVLYTLGLASATTQTSVAERDCVARNAAGKRCLVEIGTWHGVTTRRILEVMDPDGVLYGVDPYAAGRLGVSFAKAVALRETARARGRRLKWVRTTSEEAAKEHVRLGRGSVDFIFIDGDHTYEGLKTDWEGWSPLVAPGGIVALHDSRPTPDRPIEAAGSVRYTRDIIANDARFETVETVDSVTVLRRKAG